jgi:REP element-mobilizing transposase RayT
VPQRIAIHRSLHGRRSIRLRGFDYAQSGGYFLTICTAGRAHLFATVHGRVLGLTAMGSVVERCWAAIPDHFPHVRLDAFVIMPNHLHGVILLDDAGVHTASTQSRYRPDAAFHTPSRSVGSIVRGFKIGVTNWARANTSIPAVWQRNYYERILRDQRALDAVRRYIRANPRKWSQRHR